VPVEDDIAALADADFVPVPMRNATAFGFSPRLRADIVLKNLMGHAFLSNTIRVLSDGEAMATRWCMARTSHRRW
jgi:hypothetical protein